jgi:hypothetical protein
MPLDITIQLRQFVIERAAYRCEYCLMPQTMAFHKHEPDHIIPRQHGGETEGGNLALACMRCNRYKGTNVGSFDPITKALVTLFNPRLHRWMEHFVWEGAKIQPLTPEARVTVKLLRLNDEHRITERQACIDAGLFI